MADALQQRQLYSGDHLAIFVDTSAWHHSISRPPYEQRRCFQAAQQVRKAGVVHERFPSDASGFGPCVLERLELGRRHLATVDLGELGSFVGAGDRRAKVMPNCESKEIEDLSLAGLQAHR